jgi:NADH-quinone oxidoreductase subunit M
MTQSWLVFWVERQRHQNLRYLILFQGGIGLLLSMILFNGIGLEETLFIQCPLLGWPSYPYVVFTATKKRLAFIVLGHLLYLLCLVCKDRTQGAWIYQSHQKDPHSLIPAARSRLCEKGFYGLLALIQSGCSIFFYAGDMLLLYTVLEASVIPVLILVGVFGGAKRIKACYQLIVYTILGSAFGVVGLGCLFYYTNTFNIHQLPDVIASLELPIQMMIFGLLVIPFGIKAAVWPLHHWLVDVHAQAPIAGSVMLSGILLKMGSFGLMILAQLFPLVLPKAMIIVFPLAIIGIFVMLLATIGQNYWKKMIVYSSVAHMGYIFLGIFLPEKSAQMGSFFHMIAHGFISPGLFFLYAMMIRRFGWKKITDYGGMATPMPMFAICLTIMSFANLALPPGAGFVGEFFIFLGSFSYHIGASLLLMVSIVLSASYNLSSLTSIIWGQYGMLFRALVNRTPHKDDLEFDLKGWEIAIMVVLIANIFYWGICPSTLLNLGASRG